MCLAPERLDQPGAILKYVSRVTFSMSNFVRSESGFTSLNLPESSLMIESCEVQLRRKRSEVEQGRVWAGKHKSFACRKRTRAALVPFMGCSRSKTGSVTHMMPVIALIIAFIFKVPGACVAACSDALLLWALPVVCEARRQDIV